jgi:hypothetical protein
MVVRPLRFAWVLAWFSLVLATVACSDDVAVGRPVRADASEVVDSTELEVVPASDVACPDGTTATGAATDCPAPCSATCLPIEPTCTPAPESCNGLDDDCNGLIDDGLCASLDPCLTGLCLAGTCTTTAKDGPCDDGSVCTQGDACGGGVCLPGVASACDDGLPCTLDTCDAVTGCQHGPGSGPCSDGNPCTTGDHCGGGKCAPGQGNPCDDGNPCTQDACSGAAAKCSYVSLSGPCSDGNACTEQDACTWLGGGAPACIGLLKTCDDGNPCTIDGCSASAGCTTVVKPDQSPCDDGDACTQGDVCDHDGKCTGVGAPCTDANPCTVDGCAKLTGLCAHEPGTGGPCEDGNACTLGDACVLGQCIGGLLKVCADGNPCTEDTCTAIGTCTFTNLLLACDDGNACTGGDHCVGGQCTPGALPGCDDKNPCTADACVPSQGLCAHVPVNDGVACQDGVACTQGDQCGGGQCVPGPFAPCEDGNACTTDGCDGKTGGCVFTALDATPCSDGDVCTSGDVCKQGACASGPVTCQCQKDADCAGLEDGDACNGKLFCDLADHACKLDAKTVVVCDATKDSACVQWTCDKATGACNPANLNEGGPCNADGSICSDGDHCQAGVCLPGAMPGCEDSNPCTNDSCDAKLGCKHVLNSQPCNDGDPCTIDDHCVNGACAKGIKKPCDDGNVCTTDACQGGFCVSIPGFGAACNDGNPCTTGDVCAQGLCTPGQLKTCPPGGICTVGACNPNSGQCFVATAGDGTPCSDGLACTSGDHCQGGQCASGAPSCSSKNPCQAGQCDLTTGQCAFFPTGENTGCDDGNPCTVQDACKNGQCVGGATKVCPDGQPCTLPKCDAAVGGCVPKFEGLACNDNSACTTGEQCKGGACVPSAFVSCNDGNPCTKDSCNPVTGKCSSIIDAGDCDDGDKCITGETCATGKCLGLTKLDCDDDNPCTTDGCDAKTGCFHDNAAAGTPCPDNNPCTSNEVCQLGTCVHTGKGCDDGDPCTKDTCDIITGCKYTPGNEECQDGDACTKGDKCVQGKCTPGAAIPCGDGNGCTVDLCSPKDGSCSHEPDDMAACSDGDECTGGDHCLGGQCIPKPGQDACDDQNPCTTDLCDPNKGCSHTLNTAAGCSDGNACTGQDVCLEGVCISGVLLNCNDANVCTSDACDPTVGCVHKAISGPCDDANACDGPDACSGGACKPAKTFSCDDGQSCTTDACDSASGCAHYPVSSGQPCDDGNPCTSGDFCKNGTCGGTAVISCNDGNYCTLDSCSLTTGCAHQLQVGASCDDGNQCTAGDACDGGGVCQPGKLSACEDGNACTIDTCDNKSGCQHVIGSSGQGTVIAVPGDTQVQALLPGGLAQPAVATWDQYPGWTHAIPGATWLWSSLLVQKPEQTSQVAFSRTFTVPSGLGALVGHLLVATDGAFVCTLNGKLVGVNTGEQNWLQPLDQPLSGKLKVGQNVLACTVVNPGKAGSTAYTNPAGLLFRIDGTLFDVTGALACDDGNACTAGDWCKGASCQPGGILTCDDDNTCTFDSCDAKSGCVHTASGLTACSDGNACTTGDTCLGSACKPGVAASCEDFNACTADTCTPGNGCLHSALGGKGCDDGNPCTLQDLCVGSTCQPGSANPCDDGNACTADGCSTVSGCFHGQGQGGPCDDGNACTTSDQCSGATCVGTGATPCDDGNACTTDACNPTTGCIHGLATGACDDGNPCTLDDACGSGKCLGGKAKPCSDADPCTQDLCDGKTGGCSFAPVSSGPCEDGNLCTLGDTCAAGVCLPGPPRDCNDDNPCSIDGCAPATGDCNHTPAQAGYACDDANPCTVSDVCGGAGCGGVAKPCNDGNPCTQDLCSAGSGACLAKPLADGSPCGTGKVCKAGVCP